MALPMSRLWNLPKSSGHAKFPKFTHWLELPDELPKPHAWYVDEQVKKFKNTPLWYYTNEGRAAATQQNLQLANTTELIMEHTEGNTVSFVTVPSARPLKGVIPNCDLTLAQISEAGDYFCEVIWIHSWPSRIIDMF